MEILDVYDMHGKLTGETQDRNGQWGQGKYYRTVHIMIFNSRNQLLIQQRSHNKSTWPDKWDFSAAGAVDAGELTNIAAQRELFEELGISVDLSQIRPHFTVHFDKGLNDIFLLELDLDTAVLHLKEDEVQAVKWVSKEKVLEMNENGQFIEYLPSWINLVFDIRKQRGTMKIDTGMGFTGQV